MNNISATDQRALLTRLAERIVGYDLFGPYLGFVASDDPHRLLEPPDPDRPRRRTDDAIDARHIAIHKLTVGDTTPGDNRNAAED